MLQFAFTIQKSLIGSPHVFTNFFFTNFACKINKISCIKYVLHTYVTMSWGCWKHVFGIPGARPMFLKAELHKESKNGFKTINFRPPSVMIFSKNCFWSKKIIKKIGHFVDFWIFMAIYVNNLDQF